MRHVPSTRHRFILCAPVLDVAAGLATDAHAARFGRDRRTSGWNLPLGAFPRGMAGVDLSQEQRNAIRDIIRSERDAVRHLLGPMQEVQRSLRGAAEDDPVDERRIRQKAAELPAIKGDLAVLCARIGAKVHGVLTEDQRERVRELRTRPETGRARAAAARAYDNIMMGDWAPAAGGPPGYRDSAASGQSSIRSISPRNR